MSSPKLNRQDEYAAVSHELKAWASRQQPPAQTRAGVLQQAARHAPRLARRPRVWLRFQRWLAVPQRAQPMPFTELSQWLFSQSTWHHLGIDRRNVRFVC
jgi:hypothetical protein